LLQAYPGQFPVEQVERLRRAVPLARLVGLAGSWCEGEMRSGSPLPAAVRLYWHQAAPRFDRELRRLREACGGVWSLPLTATEEERLLADAEQPMEHRPGLIAIHTDRFEMEDWLSAACRRRGGSTVWLRPPRPARVEGAAAAIYDAPECGEGHLDELSHLAATLGRLPSGRPVPILALLGFPRTHHRRRALAAGATAVLSKPANLDDLDWHLDRLVDDGQEAGRG
jgi:alkylhydroperoxidase family enzyme